MVSCIGVLGLIFIIIIIIIIIIIFWGVPSHCGLYWNEVSDKLAKQAAMKNMSETPPYSNLLLSSHEIISILEKTVYKQIEKKLIWDTFLFKIFTKSNMQVTSKFMEH